MIDYQHCCREHSRRDARFRFCPECEARFFRCPHCSELITALGMCATCVRPMIEVPRGLVQPEGSELDLPVTVLNDGSRPFSIRSLTCRSGDNCVREDLGGREVSAGGQGSFSAPVRFPRAGHFKLDLLLELEWRAFGTAQHHAARLGFAALLPNAIEITARHDGPLLHTEGTGHLVNVSGAAGQSLSNALRTCGPDEAPTERLGLDPIPAARLQDFGDDEGIVSWGTEIEVPDMLAGGAARRLRPRPWDGLVLGRDRPGATDRDTGTDAALRFSPDVPEARKLTSTISRRHWRLYPREGIWWIEQLGREPTTLILAARPRRSLGAGDRAPLPTGTRIYALAGARHRLGFELIHDSVEGGHVLRSALRRC
jgi:hypothetical protein